MKRRTISVFVAMALLFNFNLTMPTASFGESSVKAADAGSGSVVKKVSLGYAHSGAVMENGDLYCWGENGSEEVGNGTTTDQITPEKVLGNVKEFSLRGNQSGAVTDNRDLYCWGGELGRTGGKWYN